MPDNNEEKKSELSAEEVLEQTRELWQKYLALTKELLKFIDRKDIDMFLEIVSQRDQLIAKMKALPENNFRQTAECQAIIEQIKPMDMQINYKARAWLNKSRRQNSAVRSYDLTNSDFGTRGVAFNRKY